MTAPTLEIRLNQTQAGIYNVTYGRIDAPLDVQEATFAENNLSMVSPAQFGYLIASQNEGDDTLPVYSKTSYDVFYDDRDGHRVVIVPDGAISKIVGAGTICETHKRFNDVIIPIYNRTAVYDAVDQMIKKGSAFCTSHGKIVIQTSDLADDELTSRLLSDNRLGIKTQFYRDFLTKQKQRTFSISFDFYEQAIAQDNPYMNRLTMGNYQASTIPKIHQYNSGEDIAGKYTKLDDILPAVGARFEKREG